MAEKTRFIGINQNIPLKLLDKHLRLFLQTGTVDRTSLKEDMALVYEGKNRADKGSLFAWRILTHDRVSLDYIKKAIGNEKYAKLKSTDRSALILALLADAYPIFYDTLGILSKVYRVQELVSRAYVAQKIGDLYGSNRTLDIALDAIFPMLIDLGVISREKKGVYKAVAGVELVDERVAELFVASGIRLSGGKHISLDDFEYRDWHFFFKPSMPPYKSQSIISVTATGGRQGYVEMRTWNLK
ncbi:MAG: hypothetical protein ACOYM2_10760 [Rectinemataceae bacterium]